MFFTILITLLYILNILETVWLSLGLHTHTSTVTALLHFPDLCQCSRQQTTCWWKRGWWTEQMEKGDEWELKHAMFLPVSYLFWGTAPILSHLSDGEKPSQGPKHVRLFLIPLLSPFSSRSSVILPWKPWQTHTQTHSHSHTNTLKELVAMHITWVLHLWRPLCFFHFATYSRDDEVEAISCT